MPEGLLNVLKPPGITSHDLVDQVRRIARTRKVGHTGTLDPAAAGVMILMLGAATRLSEFLTAERKIYRAEITLGVATDTLDGEGVIVGEPDEAGAQQVTASRLRDLFHELTGELELAPPMHSAVRHRGRRLYELAREGKEAEVAPRRIHVHRFELLDLQPGQAQQSSPAEGLPSAATPEHKRSAGAIGFRPPRALAEIECSKGTYVRSLAAEVGRLLGCGAHLSFLVRTAVGRHTVAESLTVQELDAAVAGATLNEFLIPLSEALDGIPSITVTAQGAAGLIQGVRWPVGDVGDDADLVSVLAPDGRLVCVAEVQRSAEGAQLQPRRVFPAAAPGASQAEVHREARLRP